MKVSVTAQALHRQSHQHLHGPIQACSITISASAGAPSVTGATPVTTLTTQPNTAGSRGHPPCPKACSSEVIYTATITVTLSFNATPDGRPIDFFPLRAPPSSPTTPSAVLSPPNSPKPSQRTAWRAARAASLKTSRYLFEPDTCRRRHENTATPAESSAEESTHP